MAAETLAQAPEETSQGRPRRDWQRLAFVPLAVLGWIAVAAVALWAAGHIAATLLLVAIAALLAYALYPAVRLLERFMPRALAVSIVYLLVLTALGGLIYAIITTAVEQFGSLAAQVQTLLSPGTGGQQSPLYQTLERLGVPQAQIAEAGSRIGAQAGVLAAGVVPLVGTIFDVVLRILVIGILSIYLIFDGPRVSLWLRTRTPLHPRARINFVMDTTERIVGGYIRGQILLATLIGVLVGVGMAIFQVPYAVLLGVLAFILEFVPILGVIVSGGVCVLLALTHGPLVAAGVLAYFVFVHIIEGDVVGPRIVGQAIGLHPALSIVALFAGTELFGIWGALFASPVAGVLQALLLAFWLEWKKAHPEQFPTGYSVSSEVGVIPVTSAAVTTPTVEGTAATPDAQRDPQRDADAATPNARV